MPTETHPTLPEVQTWDPTLIEFLEDKANLLRIHSVRSTTAAGSGHPTSCASAAEIMSVLFFHVMRYDPRNPRDPANDDFVLSKGHAAPVLYAAWAEAGFVNPHDLANLRRFGNDLEGHPTPRLPFVDAATGSLGQGLSVGIGIALSARLDGRSNRTYVLLGDGESAEGAVWEAAQMASRYALTNLCATIDINRLGQSEPTMLQHHLEVYEARWKAFGWNVIRADGHSVGELLDAYDRAQRNIGEPSIVLARTLKGRGLGAAENLGDRHGKPLDKAEAEAAVSEIEGRLHRVRYDWKPEPGRGAARESQGTSQRKLDAPPYRIGGPELATRKAFGDALAALGKANDSVVVIDGDVKNSTHTEDFEKVAPDRFFQGYIAEQNMVGVAMGLAAEGKIPFAATFACFFARAYDFVRMAAIGGNNIKLAGSHVGVSIGEDGPSQMGLEDLAMMCAQPTMTVLYPSDATSTWRATVLAADHQGPCYIRTSRPKTAVLYDSAEKFAIGRAKVLRESEADRATVVAAGITVFEALAAYEQLVKDNLYICVVDLFSVQPVDVETLRHLARVNGGIVITVEDHYAHGGVGDAVLGALAEEKVCVHKLAVREIPRSGNPAELLDAYGISARHIVDAVKKAIGKSH